MGMISCIFYLFLEFFYDGLWILRSFSGKLEIYGMIGCEIVGW